MILKDDFFLETKSFVGTAAFMHQSSHIKPVRFHLNTLEFTYLKVMLKVAFELLAAFGPINLHSPTVNFIKLSLHLQLFTELLAFHPLSVTA